MVPSTMKRCSTPGVNSTRASASVAERGTGDEDLGPAVVDDVTGLGRRQMGVHRGDVETGAHAGPDDLEIGRMVLEQDGEVVAPPQPAVAQHAGEPDRPLVELPIGDPTTRRRP